MKNNFFRSFLVILISSQFYFNSAWAQNVPEDPPPTEPTEPVPQELVKVDLTEIDSKELFDVLNKWKIVMTDRQTQIKKIQTSDVICVENLEDARQLGCSLYDDLRTREVFKYNKNADPLFKTLVKHISLDCEEESEVCMLAAEKLACTLTVNTYACSMEFFVSQPKKRKGAGRPKIEEPN